MIRLIRWILLPISLIYQGIVWVRNQLYDRGILSSRKFDIPTILVGNLIVGGAGKSPMTEYLIRLLADRYQVATLSRGYGRTTKGFRLVASGSSATEVGDEPLQFKRKFPQITVAVCEDRCAGIDQLRDTQDLIILDDAYQHRRLQPGFAILLFDYASLEQPKLTLPTGNYRDNFSAVKRADAIVITKCPSNLDSLQRKSLERPLRSYSDAPIFYTRIAYENAVSPFHPADELRLENLDIVLFCGIAQPRPLLQYLEQQHNRVRPILFPDHHYFSEKDYKRIIQTFENNPSENKILLTTEKDLQRIDKKLLEKLPLYYLPIRIDFLHPLHERFDTLLLDYVAQMIQQKNAGSL